MSTSAAASATLGSLHADSGETLRTLLIVGSLTVAGVGILDNAYKKENEDGTWFFQEIIALSSKTGWKTGLQDLGERVSCYQILPAPTHDDYLKDVTASLSAIKEQLKEVTHTVFAGAFP